MAVCHKCGEAMSEFEYDTHECSDKSVLVGLTCDYCDEIAVCKVTVWNRYWNLCLKHAHENKERLSIKDEDLAKLEADLKITEGGRHSSHG